VTRRSQVDALKGHGAGRTLVDMVVCTHCGQENPDGFRFCGRCGAALDEAAPRELRKTVTVLFCDLTGSTSLGEQLDPEVVRATMRRYFEELRAILERHGGTVEKFIGDAVMAVFGVPRAYEDDALRAVRAALEMRRAVAGLGLEARIGINTGGVVAGEGDSLVTGDAVNVAARLEQNAEPGEVLIGAETRRLVRDAVQVEAVELTVKGKAEAIQAYRLLDVDPEAPAVARRLDSPFVGRALELQRLRDDFDGAVAERACHLFSLIGAPGVGKSRLVAEFLDRAAANVLRGRCLHYGEGITYWPLVEVVMQLGAEVDAVIGATPEETQLTFRKLLEAHALEHLLVVVFDDLQWGEPTFLDLVEHIADWSRGAPMLLLCIARPELLDVRPAWGGGKMNAASVLLEPLGREVDVLIENLLAGMPLDPEIRSRIVETADGNPLFVEEMIAMVAEDGDSELTVPPTIHALLQARLDRLGAGERAVIERGAVEGEVFHRSAVHELAPASVRPELGQHLLMLIRKEFIRPDQPTFPDDDAFRFRHLLIRDAAYAALPNEQRAELHERFADWIAQHRELLERDEIDGYHLEQAHRYRAELQPDDPRVPELGAKAAERLGAAGQGAANRGDMPAAVGLLSRAADLLPTDDSRRLELLTHLVHPLIDSGRFDEAGDAVRELEAAHDPRLRAYGRLFSSLVLITLGKVSSFESLARSAVEARSVLEGAGDERGLAEAAWAEAILHWIACRCLTALDGFERAADHAERAGDRALTAQAQAYAASALATGPTPASEAEPRLEALMAETRTSPVALGAVLLALARVVAMRGDLERANDLAQRGAEVLEECGQRVTSAARGSQARRFVARCEGRPEREERVLREGYDALEQLGERSFSSTLAILLAQLYCELEDEKEADRWLQLARERSNPNDVVNDVLIASVEGILHARRGAFDEAERLAQGAVALADPTDLYFMRADACWALGDVLVRAGRAEDARAPWELALAELESKEDRWGAERMRRLLAEL
jgi:class 3 adenylate cyclase